MPSAENANATEQNLRFIVDNCVCVNPELHPTMYYMKLNEGTVAEREFPSSESAMRINLNNLPESSES